MAHDVKIDCFSVKFRSLKRDENGKRNEEIVLIQNLFDHLSVMKGTSDLSEFQFLFQQYINSFDGKFSVNEKTNKGISLQYEKLQFHALQQIISGSFEGGVTGQGGSIRENDDTSDENAIFYSAKSLNSKPYYFLLYLPYESNTGILLVQSFSSSSSTDAFKTHFQTVIKRILNNEYSPIISTMVMPEAIENMKRASSLAKITLRKMNLPSDIADRLVTQFSEGDTLHIELKLTGTWLDKIKEKIGITDDQRFSEVQIINDENDSALDALGFDGSEDVLYEFEKDGRKTTVKRSKNFEWEPSFYPEKSAVPMDAANKFPVFKNLNSYCIDLLDKIKNDIGVQ